jgi:hypothetical protein
MSSLSLSPSEPDGATNTSLLQEFDDESTTAGEEDSLEDSGNDEEIGGEADFSEDEVSEEDFE